MAYRWKPSKTARREFAQKMATDTAFADAYNERKEAKAEKRRSTSQFNYSSAGGRFVPTREQYLFAVNNMDLAETNEQQNAFRIVMSGFSCNEKVHHDFIHIVNEVRRANPDR